jgi:hypothetical protein
MNSSQITALKDLFENCPTATAIFDSKTLRLEHANQAMLSLWGRDNTVIGLKLLDYLPELAEQKYPDLMRIVAQSKNPYSESEAEINIVKNGKLNPIYVDYNYTPITATNRLSSGILLTATELLEKNLNKLSGEEYQRNLRALVLAAPVPMCIYRGWKLLVEVVNAPMLDLWQQQQYRNIRILKHVFHTGHQMAFTENGISYSCTALRDDQGRSVGCVLIAVQLEL